MEQSAAPAGGGRNVPPAPGRRRGSARGHYGSPARSWLTAAGSPGRVGFAAWLPFGGRRLKSRKTLAQEPGTESAARRWKENAAMERREAPAFSKGNAATEDLVRRLALHSLCLAEGKTEDGVSRAAKNRDDGARLLSYPSPERGRSARSAGAGDCASAPTRRHRTRACPSSAYETRKSHTCDLRGGFPPRARGRDKKDYLAV